MCIFTNTNNGVHNYRPFEYYITVGNGQANRYVTGFGFNGFRMDTIFIESMDMDSVVVKLKRCRNVLCTSITHFNIREYFHSQVE